MKDVVAEYEEWLRGKQNVPNFSQGRRMLCADGGPNRDPATWCHCRAVVLVIYLHLRNQVRPRTIAIIFRLEFVTIFCLTLLIMSLLHYRIRHTHNVLLLAARICRLLLRHLRTPRNPRHPHAQGCNAVADVSCACRHHVAPIIGALRFINPFH